MIYLGSRKAIALPIVLVIIGVLTITTISLIRTNRQTLPGNYEIIKRMQMKFIAKGALQHARLKMRLLSTEAYDAAAYAVGKNPLFDHAAGYGDFTGGFTDTLGQTDSSTRSNGNTYIVTNPGPAFLTGEVSGASPLQRNNVEDVNFDGSADAWTGPYPNGDDALFSTSDKSNLISNLYLVRFYEDISSRSPFEANPARLSEAIDLRTWIDDPKGNYSPGTAPIDINQAWPGCWPNSQPAIQIVSGQVDPVTGVPDMFTASYLVNEMRVLASEGSKLYGKEAVKVGVRVRIVTTGIKVTSGDASGAARFIDVPGIYEEKSVFKVSRTLE